MSVAKFLLVVALWLSVSNFHFEASGEVMPSPTGCANCSKEQLPPPISGYPSYGAPPPPPTPSGYPIYDAPPPPHKEGQSKCPPAPAAGGVQCCTPPAPYYYTNAPPYPYTYVPYGERSASTLVPVLVPLVVLFSSFIFLF